MTSGEREVVGSHSSLVTRHLSLDLLVHRMVPAGRAKLFEFQPVLVLPLVPRGRVVAVLTVAALHRYDLTHKRSFSQYGPDA